MGMAAAAREGARNLLRNCVGLKAGEHLLLVGETGAKTWFDPATCEITAGVAREAGAEARILIAPPSRGPSDFPESIAQAMRAADHTVFFTRFGDRVRFCPLPGRGSKTMCYTRDLGYLGSDFATLPHGLYEQVLERLMAAMTRARRCRITCPRGTDLSMALSGSASAGQDGATVAAEFSLKLFPVMTFPPFSAAAMSGRLAIEGWLTSTATEAYDGSLFEVERPLAARVADGRIEAFEGPAEEAGRITAHFQQVAARLGGDPMAINSWHTGINPKSHYVGSAAPDYEKWGDLTFGSPRFTHFHACGTDPGNISINLFDATISFDGEDFWRDGTLVFLERPEIRALAADFGVTEASAFEMRWDIGL